MNLSQISNYEELDTAIELIKNKRQELDIIEVRKYKVGEEVEMEHKKGKWVEAKVTKIGKTRIEVKLESLGTTYSCQPSFIRKI